MRLGHPASLAYGGGQRGIPAPYALPVGFAALLAVGTVAAALHGRLDATGVLIACTVVAGAVSFAAEPVAAGAPARLCRAPLPGVSPPPASPAAPAGAAPRPPRALD